jgi:putative hydroxymethylpyrimidine transport system substrate-binding protein
MSRLRSLLAGLALLALTPLASAQAKELKEVAIVLDWFVNPDHAALVVAQEKGFFADEGLNVELIPPVDPNAPPKMVAAGESDYALTYQPQLHLQAAEGLKVMRVATLIATPLNSLVVLKDGPIGTIADLKGRKIGFSVGGFEDALLGTMLEKAGLTLDDVELINVNFSLSPALYAGQVDAVIGAFRNFELNQMDIEGKPGTAFYPEEQGVPAYDELVLITRPDLVTNPELPKMLRAIEKATAYTINHPTEAWDAFIKAYPDLNDELNRRAWASTLPRLALRPAALDRGRYERFATYLQQRGMIEKPVPVENYAVEVP